MKNRNKGHNSKVAETHKNHVLRRKAQRDMSRIREMGAKPAVPRRPNHGGRRLY